MHLGGPDTITAYALADNELWSRHLLGLVGQVGVAIYVFLRPWIGTPINYLWIVIFVAGLVKYGERTWVLFLASREQFPFRGLDLSFQDREISLSFFKTLSWDKAFSIIEVELGLIYDLFYTKAFVLYSPHGLFLRVLSCSSTLAAFIAFLIIDKSVYPETEVIVTYFLLLGAIVLEIYAILILVSSDRTMTWLSGDWTTMRGLRKFKNPIVLAICKIVSLLQHLHLVPARMRWSNAMGQYNLLNCCLEIKPIKCTKVHLYLEKYLFWNSLHKQLGSYRGDKILLKELNCFDKSDEVEFDQSVLLWHIATYFCYHLDVNESCLEDNLKFKSETSRWLSDYMIHLLIMSPFMLPSGIGQILFQDTCAEAIEFFEDRKLSKKDACEKLLQVDTRIPPSEVKGDRSKLWNDHAEKLSQGGELLTHVWLLMAHFGMTDQFRISQGYLYWMRLVHSEKNFVEHALAELADNECI
ncbi:hypothetical protein DH2020_020187 [Rehmannia glutinosa]|uniref:DUF4220 domain-containing protein n=1 Tax=Rehmannia glutinosa TaxID=99300 RepID=A0ABR0WFD9_REHGL